MKKLRIAVATGNAHKIKEIRIMLASDGIELVGMRSVGFTGDIEENGATFEENALIKARTVCRATSLPALADDSGLCVDALGGAPGIYSARYASQNGHNATDAENVDKLLEELKNTPDDQRTARFVCAMALVFPDGKEIVVRGVCEGRITRERHGESGFGYDPVFFVERYGRTFGETTEAEKNEISHRSCAIRAIQKELLPIITV